MRDRAMIWLFLMLCSAGAICSLARVRDMGNELSPVDSYSEANLLREVRHFLESGVASHYGLGTVLYPGMYPAEGFAAEPDISLFGISADGVYTHYPPGPEYLTYIAAKFVGLEPVSRLRLLPIAIGWAATVFFGLTIRQRFGDAVGWMVVAACMITPTAVDGFVGLHYQGYSFALLLVEIALAVREKPSVAPFALLGFLQGWLTFDYVFLVTFTPLTIEFAMPYVEPGYRRRWKLAIRRVILAGGGFSAALALHFLQVWAYRGSLDGALRDFAGAAAHRAGVGLIHGPFGYLEQAFFNLRIYFYGLHPFSAALHFPDSVDPADWTMFRFLGLSLGPWWLIGTVALMIWAWFDPKSQAGALRMKWHAINAVGLATTSLWFVVMVDHGIVHRHFLYRHLFLAFFLQILFVTVTAHRLWVERTSSERFRSRNHVISIPGS